MTRNARTWGDLINKIVEENFVGRENELSQLRNEINNTSSNKLIFFITGQGGVGKTTLLDRFRDIATASDFIVTESDEQQPNIPTTLGKIAKDIEKADYTLKKFSDQYRKYCQLKQEIEADASAPKGISDFLGRGLARASFLIAGEIPILRTGIKIINQANQDKIEEKFSEWSSYLASKISNKEDVALLRDPDTLLTELFFEDLNDIANDHKVLLCFDNYEITRHYLNDWFIKLPKYEPSINIRIAIASRTKPESDWDRLRNVTITISLEPFTNEEANRFLDIYSVKDPQRRQEIIDFSGGLPILMAWLASPESDTPDPTVPTGDIVDRFLRWVIDPFLRKIALYAALPIFFNRDLLALILGEEKTEMIDTAFDWLRGQPYVKQRDKGWQYHDVVRRHMLNYMRNISNINYRELHNRIASYYDSQRKSLKLTMEEQWTNEIWRNLTLNHNYHHLLANPTKHWKEFLADFTLTLTMHRTFASELINITNSTPFNDELSDSQKEFSEMARTQIRAIKDGSLKYGFKLIDILCSITDLPEKARAYSIACRAEAFRLMRKYDNSLTEFNRALEIAPDDAWIIAHRGLTYRLIKKYNKALIDFNQVIEIDSKYKWAFVERGKTHCEMKQYDNALTDFKYALEIDSNYTSALTSRIEVYNQIEKYKNALEDVYQLQRIEPDEWEWKFKELEVLLSQNEYDQVMAWIKQFENRIPQFIEYLKNYVKEEIQPEINILKQETQSNITEKEKIENELQLKVFSNFNDLILSHDEIINRAIRILFNFIEAQVDANKGKFDQAVCLLNSSNGWVSLVPTLKFLLKDVSFDEIINVNLIDSISQRRSSKILPIVLSWISTALANDEYLIFAEQLIWALIQVEIKKYAVNESIKDLMKTLQQFSNNSLKLFMFSFVCFSIKQYDLAIDGLTKLIDGGMDNYLVRLLRAESYEKIQAYKKRIEDLTIMIDLDSEDNETITDRGISYREIKDYDKALSDFNHAIEIDPKYKSAFAQRCITYCYMKNYDKAIANISHAIKIDPKYEWAYVKRGTIHRELEEYDKAIADINCAIEIDPKYEWAFIQRGITYREMGEFDKAIADINCAIEIYPKYKLAFVERGITYREMKEFDKGIADINCAIEIDPKYESAFVQRGITYREMGELDKAIADINNAIEIYPKYKWAFLQRCITYQEMEEYDKAIADINRVIEVDSKYKWAFVKRGAIHGKMKEYDKALADFNSAIDIDAKYDWAFAERSIIYTKMKEYDKALADLNQTIEIDPKYEWAFVKRGSIYLKIREYDKALADFNSAIEIDPKYDWAFAERSIIYTKMKEYDKALTDINCAIEIDQKYKWAFVKRGTIHCEMGDYNNALADVNQAIEIDPKYDYAYAERGVIYRNLSEYDKSLADLNLAIEINPKYEWAFVERGVTYLRLKEYNKALADINQAIEIDPKYDYAYAERGVIYHNLSEYNKSLADLNKAIEIDPKYSWSYVQRGITYRDMNEYDEAISDFNSAIDIDPKYDWAFGQLGITHRELKDYEKALDSFKRAIEIDREDEWHYYERALTYKLLKQNDASKKDINTAIKIVKKLSKKNPDDWSNVCNLGLFYLAANQLEQAKKLYNKILTTPAPVYDVADAIDDIEKFLLLFPEYTFALNVIEQLKNHLEKGIVN